MRHREGPGLNPEVTMEQTNGGSFGRSPRRCGRALGAGIARGGASGEGAAPTGLLFMEEKWAEGKRRGLGKGRVSRSQPWKGRGVA